MKITEITRILSATGSKNFPNEDSTESLLARKPSKKSVIQASPKKISATQLKKTVCGKRHKIMIGIDNILKTVNRFGMSDNLNDLMKFIINFLC